MYPRILICYAFGITLGGLAIAPPALAANHALARLPQASTPLIEMPDPELAALRGRFIIGNHAVAYFGVNMLSTWSNPDGLQMQGGATLGLYFDASGAKPRTSFTPTMTIVRGAPPAQSADAATRSVDAAGLANVGGLLQGVQIAGDGNRAVNAATLKVTTASPNAPETAPATIGQPFAASTHAGDARIALAFDPTHGVSVELGVAGQGLVAQWVRAGTVGQSVQLTADGQAVANVLQLDLVLNQGQARATASHDVAQALLQARANGTGGWQ